MKKKILILFFIIFTSLILKNCIMIKIEDESSIRPTFDFQKTYILKHIPSYFMAYYYQNNLFCKLETTSIL